MIGRSTRHCGFVLATAPIGPCPVLHPVHIPATIIFRHCWLLDIITTSYSYGTIDCWVSPRRPLGRVKFFLGISCPAPPSGNQYFTVAACLALATITSSLPISSFLLRIQRFMQERSHGRHCLDAPLATAVSSFPRLLLVRFQSFIRSSTSLRG